MNNIHIWVHFLSTGIGPELCDLKKKVWMVAVTKCEEKQLFLQLIMGNLFTKVLGKKYGSL